MTDIEKKFHVSDKQMPLTRKCKTCNGDRVVRYGNLWDYCPITDEEIGLLYHTRSSQDWSDTCKLIKSRRDGEYPPNWWPIVIQSGMADRIMKSWDNPSSATLTLQEL